MGYRTWGRTYWITCPDCGKEYGVSEDDMFVHCPYPECKITEDVKINYRFKNAQLGERERPVVWADPKDPNPETRYRFAATYNPETNPDMPKHFKDRGFERVEFNNLREHERFQKETNTVNHKTWDISPSRNY